MKKFFRVTIDILVIVMVALFLFPYVYSYLPFDYTDETIPDEVKTIDSEIEEFMHDARSDFIELYNNPAPLETYNFRELTTRIPLTDQDNYQQSVESIVYITTFDGVWIYVGSGSILTEDGVILTNHHVIADSEQVVVTTYEGKTYEVTDVLAYDENIDVAFLKINATGLTPLPVGDSEKVDIGDKTLVIGHPESYINTLSLGNISGRRDYRSQNAGIQLQITNPISMGNSGGAVLNEFGEIIAVPSWALEYKDNIVQVQNLNFAIPIHEALRVLSR